MVNMGKSLVVSQIKPNPGSDEEILSNLAGL